MLLSLPGTLSALMPPDKMAQRNLEAQFIIAGKVISCGKVLLPEKNKNIPPLKGVFSLEIVHIIKGYSDLKDKETIKVLYRLLPKAKGGIKAERQGTKHVKVQKNDLVIVYLDHSRHPDFYWPLAQGSSVITIQQHK